MKEKTNKLCESYKNRLDKFVNKLIDYKERPVVQGSEEELQLPDETRQRASSMPSMDGDNFKLLNENSDRD